MKGMRSISGSCSHWLYAVVLMAVMGLLLAGCTSNPKATGGDELDIAIREASDYLNIRIPKGNKVAFINISGGFPDLADYILSDLSKHGVNDSVFSVVDRASLDQVRAELNFNMSGEVSDQSAQEIGRMLGAQTIVSGSVRRIGAMYRLDVKAIEVQTASVQGQWNKNIPDGMTIAALTENTSTGASASAATSGGTSGQTVQTTAGSTTAQAQPALLPNGTYTFFPRPRMMRLGQDINAYLDRIVVRSGYFTLHITSVPVGAATGYADLGNWAAYSTQGLLYNLDQPTRPPIVANSRNRQSTPTMTSFYIFDNHNIRRFKFEQVIVGIGADPNTTRVFEEINIDNAEYEPL